MSNNIPNTFIAENGTVVFVNIYEMTTEDMTDIDSAKAYCNIVEKYFGTNSIDEMIRKGMGYEAMNKYNCARYDLLKWGYKPEDWAE